MPKLTPKQSKPTCGDNGGKTAKGLPCPRTAGWGTGTKEGRCKSHNEENDSRVREVKKSFLEQLSDPHKSMAEASLFAGMDYSTLWLWRKQDKAFDEAINALQTDRDKQRLTLVEDSLFKRVVAGTASPAETIFWLKNRGSNRWKDMRQHEHSAPDGEPLAIQVYVPDNIRD